MRLSCSPGTKLYNKALADGVIKNEAKEVYEKHFFIREPSYLNLLILVMQNMSLPGWLLRFLVSFPVLALLNNRAMRPVIGRFYVLAKRLHAHFIAPKQNPTLNILKSRYQ